MPGPPSCQSFMILADSSHVFNGRSRSPLETLLHGLTLFAGTLLGLERIGSPSRRRPRRVQAIHHRRHPDRPATNTVPHGAIPIPGEPCARGPALARRPDRPGLTDGRNSGFFGARIEQHRKRHARPHGQRVGFRAEMRRGHAAPRSRGRRALPEPARPLARGRCRRRTRRAG